MPTFSLDMPIWAFATSLVVCALAVMTQRWHGRHTLDHDLRGVQKIHRTPVPRIGGLGLLAGLLAATLATWLVTPPTPPNGAELPYAHTMGWLLLCALPTFGAGLLEDLTKRVSVRMRLLASFASAALAAWLLGAQLDRLNIPGLDELMALPLVAVPFTVFAVGGVTNSVNIIDGLNGLASGSVAIMLAGLGTIAWLHGDGLVLHLCAAGIAATLGFMLLNYPFGRIFLGDGGAYLAGFWLAECAVLLLVRNPEVSTWAPLLACCYPVWETIFSMFRRRVVRRAASGGPDRMHLHHLVLDRLMPQATPPGAPAWVRHAGASALIWSIVVLSQSAAIQLNTDTSHARQAALFLVAGCCVLYALIARSHRPTLASRRAPAPVLPDLHSALERPGLMGEHHPG